jgi:riboflavin biosynthesis pyrimidine reductase
VSGEPVFERLLPPAPPAGVHELLAGLRPWERAPGDRPLVMVNMVATADGLITIGGRSGPIGGPGDHALFHGLRTIVDAVLVGTGTLRVERYGRVVRDPARRARRAELGLAEDPIALLISHSGNLPWDAPLFHAPEQHVVVVTQPERGEVPDGLAARVDVIRLPAPSPAVALRAVHEAHGIRAVLCEGGPTLNRGLLADGVLDELFLTIGPKLAVSDDALRIVAGEPMDAPVDMELLSVARHESELYLRYALAT